MLMQFDSIDELILNEELVTAIIELIITLIAFWSILVLKSLKKTYPKLTEKGFSTFQIGFLFIALHFLCDFLDTLAIKEIDDQITLLYTIFDICDAVFSAIGLFIIGIAFYQIAKFGMTLWEEKNV